MEKTQTIIENEIDSLLEDLPGLEMETNDAWLEFRAAKKKFHEANRVFRKKQRRLDDLENANEIIVDLENGV